MNVAPLRRIWWKLLAGLMVVLAAMRISLFAHKKWKYPYGWSHCCIKGMGSSLRCYAMDHEGRFPAGGDTPEASLSLLYSNYIDAYTLRGKTVPLEVTQAALTKNGKLGPDSCGWHYVEGLTEADDPEIVILWDKIGLDHNGGRRKGGGHEVAFVDGSCQFVTGRKWSEFLEKQRQLFAKRDEKAKLGLPALTGKIRFPDGTEVSDYNGPYKLYRGSGSESGRGLKLRWMRFYESDGLCTLTLELPDKLLRSKPVTVRIASGRVTPETVIFEMQPY